LSRAATTPGLCRLAVTGGVLCLLSLPFFVGLGAWPLMDPDEGRNAEIAREMLASGSWIVPYFNGLPFLDKPVGLFWLIAAAFRVGARLPQTTSRVARGDRIVTMDGDGQNCPEDIPAIGDRLERAALDVVCGIRTDRRDGWRPLLMSRVANAVRARVLRDGVRDSGCVLRPEDAVWTAPGRRAGAR
jgi:hypothetical protein